MMATFILTIFNWLKDFFVLPKPAWSIQRQEGDRHLTFDFVLRTRTIPSHSVGSMYDIRLDEDMGVVHQGIITFVETTRLGFFYETRIIGEMPDVEMSADGKLYIYDKELTFNN